MSAVGSRDRRGIGMLLQAGIPMPRRTRASARSGAEPEAPTPDAFGIARAKPKYGTPSGVSAGSCCPHHVAARRISKQLEETQAVFFYACVSFFPQNSLRDFCGSPENERHGWRSFFVRQGREPTAAERAGINEKLLSAVGSRGRRVRGMPACRSIPKPRRTRASARSRVKPDI